MLVGDAGYLKDPCTAEGITDAFHSAELLVEAIDSGFSGRQTLDEALATYEQERNNAAFPLYDFTCQLATLAPPPPEMQQLLAALKGNQEQTDRFFGIFAQTVSAPEFLAPENMQRIFGPNQHASVECDLLLRHTLSVIGLSLDRATLKLQLHGSELPD